jgi:hypothetical protein
MSAVFDSLILLFKAGVFLFDFAILVKDLFVFVVAFELFFYLYLQGFIESLYLEFHLCDSFLLLFAVLFQQMNLVLQFIRDVLMHFGDLLQFVNALAF